MRYPPLTPDQQQTVLDTLPLARWWASRLVRRRLPIPFDEICQICDLAVCRAVQRHDPARGRLAEVVKWQIRAGVTDWFTLQRPAGMKNRTRYPLVPATVAHDPDEIRYMIDCRYVTR